MLAPAPFVNPRTFGRLFPRTISDEEGEHDVGDISLGDSDKFSLALKPFLSKIKRLTVSASFFSSQEKKRKQKQHFWSKQYSNPYDYYM